MELNHEWKKEKQEELVRIVEDVLSDFGCDARAIAEQIIDVAVTLSPPEKEQLGFELVTLRPDGRGGGRSRKPGNIRLNMRKLIEAVSAGIITTVGAIQAPITIPFATLVLWNSIWRCVDIKLSDSDAALLYVMWMHRDSNQQISYHGLLEKVNMHLGKYGRQPLSKYDVKHSLENLEKIGSIKKSKKEKDNWWLCEWIEPVYK